MHNGIDAAVIPSYPVITDADLAQLARNSGKAKINLVTYGNLADPMED